MAEIVIRIPYEYNLEIKTHTFEEGIRKLKELEKKEKILFKVKKFKGIAKNNSYKINKTDWYLQ